MELLDYYAQHLYSHANATNLVHILQTSLGSDKESVCEREREWGRERDAGKEKVREAFWRNQISTAFRYIADEF